MQKDGLCCCLTSDREVLTRSMLELIEKMGAEQLQTLYIRAMAVAQEPKLADAIKRQMIDCIVEQMDGASPEKVRALFLCARNILE